MFESIRKFLNTNMAFLIILMVVAFSLYGKAINYELLQLDEQMFISNNVLYISNIKNIPKLFLQDVYYKNSSNYYRPILSLTFSLETIIFGYRTQVYHTTNILLFVISFYLIYLFCLKLKLNKNISKFCCLLFLVHPVFTSIAVWIAARNDTLLLIFVLLSFINFIDYITLNKNKYLIYAVMSFILALFTKETAMVSVLFYFLLVYCFKYEINKKQIYTLSVGLLLSLIIYFVFRTISVSSINIFDLLKNYKGILNNIVSCLFVYTEKIVLCSYIPVLTYNTNITKSMALIFSSLFMIVFISYLKYVLDRKQILFCVFWYVAFLFPTFVIVEHQLLFHRLLLPLVGIIIFIVLFVNNVLNKYPVCKKYLIILFVLLSVSLSYASFLQKEKYKTAQDFVLNCYLDSKNRISDLQFISFLVHKGDYKKAKNLLEERMKKHITKRDILTYAKILFYEGNIEQAENIYLQLETDLHEQKELIYFELSRIYEIKKDYSVSLEYILKAYNLNPYDTPVLIQLANIYELAGNIDKALIIYNDLFNIDKNNKIYKDKIEELTKKQGNKK